MNAVRSQLPTPVVRLLIGVVLVYFLVSGASAQVAVSFPSPSTSDAFGFVPVRLSGPVEGATWVELRAKGAVPTRLMLGGATRVDNVYKWLTFAPVDNGSVQCNDSTGRRIMVNVPEFGAGPTSIGVGGAVEPRGYLPTYGWKPGTPYETRKRVMLATVACGIVAVLVSLAARRPAVGVVVVSVIAGAAGAAWDVRRDPVVQVVGHVVVREGNREMIDTWTYQTSKRATHTQFDAPSDGVTLPILADPDHAERIKLLMIVRPDGATSFAYDLPADGRMAFVTRQTHPISQAQPMTIRDAATPMAMLGKSLYAGDGRTLIGAIGTTDESEEFWPGVAIASDAALFDPVEARQK